jgi:hypothetical protein
LSISLEVEDEFVETLRDLEIKVERLVEIAFAVVVEVLEAPEAVATGYIDFIINYLEAECMIETAGEPAPCDSAEISFESRYQEDIAVKGTDRRTAIGKEVESSDKHRRRPGIGIGELDGIYYVRNCGLRIANGGL